MASGFEEVTAEDVASDVKGLKFFGKEDNEKLNDESNADSIYVISQKTESSKVRKFLRILFLCNLILKTCIMINRLLISDRF